MKKPKIAISNHNRRRRFDYVGMNPHLAYIIGVYMGDGSICNSKPVKGKNKSGSFLQLGSIDLDFVENVVSELSLLFNYKPNIHITDKNKSRQYYMRFCCKDFTQWLESITDHKTKIPTEILSSDDEEIIKPFLIGLMDSEASISGNKNQEGLVNWSLQFGIIDLWCLDVYNLFKRLGVKVGKIHQYPSGYNKPSGRYLIRFGINLKSYYDKGLNFSIKRKNELLNEYIQKRAVVMG